MGKWQTSPQKPSGGVHRNPQRSSELRRAPQAHATPAAAAPLPRQPHHTCRIYTTVAHRHKTPSTHPPHRYTHTLHSPATPSVLWKVCKGWVAGFTFSLPARLWRSRLFLVHKKRVGRVPESSGTLKSRRRGQPSLCWAGPEKVRARWPRGDCRATCTPIPTPKREK